MLFSLLFKVALVSPQKTIKLILEYHIPVLCVEKPLFLQNNRNNTHNACNAMHNASMVACIFMVLLMDFCRLE